MADKIVKSEASLAPIEMAQQLYKLEELKRDVEDRLRVLKAGLLETMNGLGVLTLKTKEYTISRKTYNRVIVNDDEAAKLSLEKMDVPVKMKLDMAYMREPVKLLIEQGKTIEGITTAVTDFVSVRPTKKPSDKPSSS